jgi:putative membrane-bound dehydrogenase-like protein
MRKRPSWLLVFWALAGVGAAPPTITDPRPADPDAPPPPLSPAEAVRRFQVADGLAIRLAVSEPEVTQPLSISFDDRGRMWVLQYRQYPLPEGLKPVSMDQYLRTKYDRVPEPPPKGPKGRDRISIYENVDGSGRFKLVKHFVTGLNLASGMALGYDGVFVVQPPYLLFYPDKNHDDVPDVDPEVLLRGFGMEDAHAFANSLTWGPDGWLYGCQGSTVTANIRGIEFQQGAWRYHPRTKEFELFAEGGGNSWGLEFDRFGNLFAFGNTVEWLVHHVQGAYYVKGFGKHGPLHNPHAYGYFPAETHYGFIGDSLKGGAIFYQGGAFPERFNNAMIAPNGRHSAVRWSTIETRGSTFVSRFAGDFVTTPDIWFRPVDQIVGPDGALYIADWYDYNISHSNPKNRSQWYMPSRDDGRVWRVAPPDLRTVRAGRLDLAKRTSRELIDLLRHPNDWYAREARQIFAERKDRSILPELRGLLSSKDQRLALQGLWSVYVIGGLDEGLAEACLDNPHEYVRAWTVRLLGDGRQIPARLLPRVVRLAREDRSAVVRSQLACTAKRLPGRDALALVGELVKHDEDVHDAHIPLLVWWALEDKAVSDTDRVLGLFGAAETWRRPLVRDYLTERLARRYAAEGTDAGYAACAQLLHSAPSPEDRGLVVSGCVQAFAGRRLDRVPGPLEKGLVELLADRVNDPRVVELALRLGYADGPRHALRLAQDRSVKEQSRVELIRALGECRQKQALPELLGLLEGKESQAVQDPVVASLGYFDDAGIAPALLRAYPRLPRATQAGVVQLLAGRRATALPLLEAVAKGTIDAKVVSEAQLRQMLTYRDDRIAGLVAKHWGRVGPATPFEKQGRITAVLQALARGPGDAARGMKVFEDTCLKCHKLHGWGGSIGPDLTGAERKDAARLVPNIVDPNGVIREGYLTYVAALKDGRTLTGLLAEATPQTVTLLDAENRRTVVNRGDIEELSESRVSLMPEGLLDALSEQRIRDLIAFLKADALPARPKTEPASPATLPDTRPLAHIDDMAAETVAGVDRFLLRALERSVGARARHWKRDLSSHDAYVASVEPNRRHFARIIGVRDPRVPCDALEFISPTAPPTPVGRAAGYEVWAVRWRVLDGISGEGLLLEPIGKKPVASVVAPPDCGQTPEMLAGLTDGVPRDSQFARRLAENGCRVIVPALIDRGTQLSVIAGGNRRGNVSHRELLYRSAYQMGRHLIGYEVQKVLAAVDWFAKDGGANPVGVVGYGEGGLLALYVAALNPRIGVTAVSGYFDSRQGLWREPIDRNVFGLLDEFGDAEIASLVAPRALLVEACAVPDVTIPPGADGAPARLTTPPADRVRGEVDRLRKLVSGLTPPPRTELIVSGDGKGPFGTAPFLDGFLNALGRPKAEPSGEGPGGRITTADAAARLKRQFSEILNYSERLIDESAYVREDFLAKLNTKQGVGAYMASAKPYREYFRDQILGRIEDEPSPPNPRSRLAYDTPEFRGYEVALDVLPDVVLYGILLLPKDLQKGEKCPVVVCQHGLEGRARDTVEGDRTSYRDFAARLARRGFITFAPQHLYRGGDRFRALQRKANPLGKSLFSVMVAQHSQLLRWLATLDGVDPARIAFYGISYGGKSAMRIPAVVEGYCLSICSSDFSDWVWRTVSSRHANGYLAHSEYEIFEFDLGNTFNYAEMAALICPRPFMAERFPETDPVARWTLAEFAKVRLLYERLGLADRVAVTTYASFQGQSAYEPRQTFDFLHRHLRWPEKRLAGQPSAAPQPSR